MEMNNTYNFLQDTAYQMIADMEDILMRDNRNATHSLSNSLIEEVRRTGQGFIFEIQYADHGKYVLNSDWRRDSKRHPSKEAIRNIMDWIVNKGIPVSGGRLRTPLTNKNNQLQPSAKSYKMVDERERFAKAIWYKNRQRLSFKTPKTNFLKPFTDTFYSKDFTQELSGNLTEDGIQFIGKDFSTFEIQIKT